MLHLRHRGTKGFIVKMDDRANRRFNFHFFYIKIEHVVTNPSGFPEVWNFARKYLFQLISYLILFCFVLSTTLLILFFFYAAEREPPTLVADIRDW